MSSTVINQRKLMMIVFSRKVEGAVGYGDPRQLKEYLSKHGVECWLDVERAGKVSKHSKILRS